MREIVLDTETTGLNPKGGHRIVEIGCVELVNHMPTGETYHQYINPERDIPEEVIRVHGIDNERVKDEPVFSQISEAFLDFLADSTLVIHNAEFDMGFINAELARLGVAALPMTRTIDTVKIARKKFPGAQANLDALCRRFGIDNSSRVFHGALLDADLLANVYLELIGGRQPGLELASDEGKAALALANQAKIDRPFREPRPHAASAEELATHEEFVKKLKDPVWQS